ncbi:oxaloacetate decarboxylase alpha chain [Moraxella equi]|uniref:Uncharacterized protein n=1 Tax=Moraxella equi TaxID=60442 RepID=A0A378QRW2_9GAMM|nr:oxaloacetate decarboxylase alpha chain [Moraxella equi]STZ03646.1 Uncharacterised protein [Moraxella equi]
MTQPKPTLVVQGDILKSEADRLTRIEIPAPTGTKMGELVEYKLRKQKLVALTNEEHGKVQVQPHNCVINLDFVNLGSEKAETLAKQGDTYGIKYISPNGNKKPSGETTTSGDSVVSGESSGSLSG